MLRVDRTRLAAQPPQYDPGYSGQCEVTLRDLAVYERFAALERSA